MTYRSVSVVPWGLAEALRKVWAAPAMALSLWGSLGAAAGHVAFIVLAVALLLKADVADWLKAHGYLSAAIVGVAAWLGFTIRLALASRYQLRHERRKGVTAVQRDGAIGLLLLLVWWSYQADPLALGWAAVVAIAAYLSADAFCQRRSRREPEFLRDVA